MESTNPSSGTGDALARARELRASLIARRDAEALMAEGVKVRQDAAEAATDMIARAQQACDDLLRQTRAEAEQIDSESRERADSIISKAQREADWIVAGARATADELRNSAFSDAEEHRRRVYAEVTAQVRQQMDAERRRVLDDAHMRAAQSSGRLAGSMQTLRENLDAAAHEADAVLTMLGRPGDSDAGSERIVGDPGEVGPEDPGGPSIASTHHAATVMDQARRSATEAFLSSDWVELAQADRELHQLREADRARRRRAEDKRRAMQGRDQRERADERTHEGVVTVDPAAESLRPLGWLFRSAP